MLPYLLSAPEFGVCRWIRVPVEKDRPDVNNNTRPVDLGVDPENPKPIFILSSAVSNDTT